jgi:hypothetical protein
MIDNMLYTPHFLTGAAVMNVVPDPFIGLPLALLSHFMLDATPHHDFDVTPGVTIKDLFDFKEKKNIFTVIAVAVDGLLMTMAFIWIFTTQHNYMLLLGGVVGISPDVFEQSFLLFGKPLPAFQDRLQRRVSAKYGFIS